MTPIFYLFIVAEDNRLFSISNDKTIKVGIFVIYFHCLMSVAFSRKIQIFSIIELQ